MEYKKGTIVMNKNVIFKDNGKADNKYSRPVALPVTKPEFNDEFYYLTITSSDKTYLNNPNFYPLGILKGKNDKADELKKPSYANIDCIYKGTVEDVTNIYTGLPPGLFRDLIKTLKEHQEARETPDELYPEICNII